MTDPDEDSLWWGTSDAPSTLRRRAQSTPLERWTALSDLVDLAAATGALARSRALKQGDVDRWSGSDR